MKTEEKYKVIARLQEGSLTQREIADELGVSYSGVISLSKQYEQAKLNNTIDQLVDTDKLVLHTIGEVLEQDTAELTKGVEGLEQLSTALQRTAMQINSKASSLIMSVENPSELETYTDIIVSLQSAFLNKALTQVNVQNNYSNESAAPKYGAYLSDKPGD